MKYKLFGIVMMVFMLVAAAVFTPVEQQEKEKRYHQHREARWDSGCDCDGTQLCSHLPLVIIDSGGQEIPGRPSDEVDRFGEKIPVRAKNGDSVITVKTAVIDNKDTNNHPTDTPDFFTDCEFRVRGHSSRDFPKSSYMLKFVDENGGNRDLAVMGMSSHHDWVLHGPILDKSLLRNYMWYNISGEVMDYAPNVRFCELILDGEYQGLYLMTESITDGRDCRLHLNMHIKDVEKTGYLLRLDRPTEEDLESTRDIYSYNEREFNITSDIAIRYPGKPNLTTELAKSIELDYSAFEKALFSYDYDTEDYGYWNWIDVDNFVDYYLINEFTRNADASRYSTYIYKEIGEKYKLCVWDFNNACDNYRDDEMSARNFTRIRPSWFYMLFRDEEFVEKVLQRYDELREDVLSEEYLMSYIDETLAYLGDAVTRNNERWAVEMASWNLLMPESRNPHSQEEAVAQLKKWIVDRGNWLDENIHALRAYAHPSRNKNYNH